MLKIPSITSFCHVSLLDQRAHLLNYNPTIHRHYGHVWSPISPCSVKPKDSIVTAFTENPTAAAVLCLSAVEGGLETPAGGSAPAFAVSSCRFWVQMCQRVNLPSMHHCHQWGRGFAGSCKGFVYSAVSFILLNCLEVLIFWSFVVLHIQY